jgi:t-SNARE complex subunit (syntaxin)
MEIADAVNKAKRDCLILQEFLTDDDIQNHITDVAGTATDYTAAMIDEANR